MFERHIYDTDCPNSSHLGIRLPVAISLFSRLLPLNLVFQHNSQNHQVRQRVSCNFVTDITFESGRHMRLSNCYREG